MGAVKYSRPERYSYSRVNVLHNCGYRYKLTYVDKHYINQESLAIELGTLIHFIEENIGLSLKDGVIPDYDKLKKDLYELNIPKKSPTDTDGGIYGINILKEKYRDDFYKLNDKGESYYTLILKYAESGIYRLQRFLEKNPDWVVHAVEQGFEVDYYCAPIQKHITLQGFIDRILKNVKTGEYIIEDIKTRQKLFPDEDLKSPMQFFFYSYALKSMERLFDYPVHVRYDLVLMDERQPGGTDGWINRCHSKLDKDMVEIANKNFAPKPGPLCAYCPFSQTYADKDKLEEKDRYLCPYYSKWTKYGTAKSWDVERKWEGPIKHDRILAEFQDEMRSQTSGNIEFNFDDLDY